jgi:serine/threonine protein kinase
VRSEGPSIPPEVQEIFDEFLDQQEADSTVSFGSLLDKHPRYHDSLKQLFAHWQEFHSFAGNLRQDFGVAETEEHIPPGAKQHLERLQDRSKSSASLDRLGELGRGGMGVVYKVWDEDLQRQLAMKVLRTNRKKGSQPQTISHRLRFLNEAQITGQLHHPGVVPVHQIGINESGDLYFTMARVQGRNLAEILRRYRAGEEGWNRTRILGVLLKVSETLAYAHSKEVIHRDLKPSNIMVGRFGEVYVMDWGLARSSTAALPATKSIQGDPGTAESVENIPVVTLRDRRDPSSAVRTLEGQILGTPAFMAPEQAFGRVNELGPRSDVYSLGAILYHILAGHPPYMEPATEHSSAQIVALLREGPPTPIRIVAPPATPGELLAIAEKAMQRRSDQRYSMMEEMADDLRAYLENRVVKSYRTGASAELKKWIQRNPVTAIAVAGALLFLVLGLGGMLGVQLRANRQLGAAEAETRREADLHGRTVDWLKEVFSLSDPELARGEVVTAKEMVDLAALNLASLPAEAGSTLAQLSMTIGDLYNSLGLRSSAIKHFEIALQAAEKAEGPLSSVALQNKANLAMCLTMQKTLPRAAGIFEELRKEVPLCPDIASNIRIAIRGSEATHLRFSGQLQQSEELYLDAIAAAEELLPPGHKQTLMLRSNLAVLYTEQKRHQEALDLNHQVLHNRMLDLGEDHPHTILSINNVACVHRDMGEPVKAKEGFEKAVQLGEKILNRRHPLVVSYRFNLAGLLWDIGEFSRAHQHLTELLADAEDTLLPADPLLLKIRKLTVSFLLSQGRVDQAEVLARRDYESRVQLFGKDHPSMVTALLSLSGIHKGREEYVEAQEKASQALQIARRTQVHSTETMLKLLDRLGYYYFFTREYGKAELLLTEAHELAVDKLGPFSPFLVRSIAQMANLRRFQKNYQEAELLYQEAVELAEEHLPPAAQQRLHAQWLFADFLEARGFLEEALEVADRLMEATPEDYYRRTNYEQTWDQIRARLGLKTE